MSLRKYTSGEGNPEIVSEDKQQKIAAKIKGGKSIEEASVEVEQESE